MANEARKIINNIQTWWYLLVSGYLCIPTAACLDQDVLHLSASNLARWQCPATITSPHKDDQSESQLVFQWPVRFFTKVRVDTANQGTYAKKEKRENVGIFPKSGNPPPPSLVIFSWFYSLFLKVTHVKTVKNGSGIRVDPPPPFFFQIHTFSLSKSSV